MANLIIQENGKVRTRPAVNGEELTIKTPCDCTAVSGVQINNVAFPFCDTCGNSMQDIRGKFAKGSLIRVMIDTVNVRAYILNSAKVTPKPHTHSGDEVYVGEDVAAILNLNTPLTINDAMSAICGEKVKMATGTYVGDGKFTKTLTFDFAPKLIVISTPAFNSGVGYAIRSVVYGFPYMAGLSVSADYDPYATITWGDDGKSVTFSGNPSDRIMNGADIAYHYVAIGTMV